VYETVVTHGARIVPSPDSCPVDVEVDVATVDAAATDAPG
jgi:hypothetical protein